MKEFNGLLVIEDVPVSQIYARYQEENEAIGKTADSLSISEVAVEEAIQFKEKYPLEVHRDAVRKQSNKLEKELELRQKALDAFLEDCRQCGRGEYRPVFILGKSDIDSTDDLYDDSLCNIRCLYCGHTPL